MHLLCFITFCLYFSLKFFFFFSRTLNPTKQQTSRLNPQNLTMYIPEFSRKLHHPANRSLLFYLSLSLSFPNQPPPGRLARLVSFVLPIPPLLHTTPTHNLTSLQHHSLAPAPTTHDSFDLFDLTFSRLILLQLILIFIFISISISVNYIFCELADDDAFLASAFYAAWGGVVFGVLVGWGGGEGEEIW